MFLTLFFVVSIASAVNNAVEVNIGGIGPAVDEAAFNTVKQVIGSAVANGVVDKFEVRGYGIEGGFSACAQASPYTKNFPSMVKQLRTIKPNKSTTFYSVVPVSSCSEQITVCTEDAKLCPDGSYVGRVPPSCAFAPCPSLIK
jgi:hypothetical protein